MSTPTPWLRIFVIGGLAGILIGAVDPLEGWAVILPSIGLAAFGAFLVQSPRRRLLYWAFASTVIGVSAMLVLSRLGGIGGGSGRSIWWAVVILPYPVGWILGLAGAALEAIEVLKHHAPPRQAT